LKRRLLLLFVVALVVAGAGAFVQRLLTPLEVRAAAVARGPALATVFATGWIEACERRYLRPARPAVVARLFKREGDEVRAGEPLVELRDTAREQREERVRAELDRISADLAEESALRRGAQARIQEATVAEEWAAEEVVRMKPLLEQQLIDRRAFDQLETNRRMAAERRRSLEQVLAETLGRLGSEQRQFAAELEVLRANTKDDRILAPFDGVVLLRFAEEGESVHPERDLLKFGDLRELRIEGDVDEDDVARVRAGQRVFVRLAGDDAAGARTRERLTGEVTELFPDGNRATRSFRVRVRFLGAEFVPDGPLGLRGRLRAGAHEIVAGTSVELGIVVEEKADALVIPRAALTARGTVYVLEGGRAHERDVAVGIRNFDRCEVLGGVTAGELVAIEQLGELHDGRRATPRVTAEAPPYGPGAGAPDAPGGGR
jgi:HlyD family secretion protein